VREFATKRRRPTNGDVPRVPRVTLQRARRWLRRRRGARELDASSRPLPEAAVPTAPREDLLQEELRAATFRIRNLSAVGTGTGAGFAIGSHLIVTNRHVVERADPLEVTTWDGRPLEVDVADLAEGHDLALLTTVRTLQKRLGFASSQARRGDLVHLIGYPLGGPFSLIRGLIIDQVDGQPFEDSSHVLRIKAVVLPGYSGGPILDARGQVVGVIYAQGRASRNVLAIPVSSLTHWLDGSGPDQFISQQDSDTDT
jgi:S1-C subfamily serine protease